MEFIDPRKNHIDMSRTVSASHADTQTDKLNRKSTTMFITPGWIMPDNETPADRRRRADLAKSRKRHKEKCEKNRKNRKRKGK